MIECSNILSTSFVWYDSHAMGSSSIGSKFMALALLGFSCVATHSTQPYQFVSFRLFHKQTQHTHVFSCVCEHTCVILSRFLLRINKFPSRFLVFTKN